MDDTMPAVVKTAAGPGHVEVRTVDAPVSRPGRVIVEVSAAGVCGTDLHIIDDHYPNRPPVVMGHEVAGVVVDVGDGVDPAWLGAAVACESHHQVCDCEYCRTGRRNLCPNKASMGSFVPGGFARWMSCPVDLLHRLPDGVSLQVGAMSEPLACVCHLLLDPAVVAVGDRVLVTGPGPMGLIAAQVARASGGRVVVSGLPADAARLEVAAALGFDTTTSRPEGVFDVVVECSGSAGGARMCLELAAKSGRYVSVGIQGKDVSLPLDLVLYNELTITSGFAATARSWQRAMAVLSAGLVDLEPLVSSIEPLERWDAVVADLRSGIGMKVLFDPHLSS